jgi:hypothetical protein
MPFTQVLVRVQAKGGKFLGPDAGFSQVTVRDAGSGKVLAQGIADGESGQLSGAFTPGATRQNIVTPMWGTDNVLWLSATPGQATAGLTAALELDAPTLVELSAAALTDGQPNGHTVSQTMWIEPGVDLTTEPGVVLVMPGLLVKDVAAVATPGEPSVSVTAWVSMMCGCKIDPTLPWVPTGFAVTATVTDATGKAVAQMPLTCQGMSIFATQKPLALPGPGTYTVSVTAVQAAEANAGSASATFTVPG